MSQINVNNIVGKNGASAVSFPHGINVTGVVTATQLTTQNVTGNVTASGTITGGAFSGPLTGNVTGTADLASGLTGTPNITVGTVTGTDATFSGDLTVNGTTTTIDTAVTAVDSLAVDGSVGIGTTNPATSLEIGNGHIDPVIRLNDPGDRRMSIRGPSANNLASVGTESSHDLAFFTNGYSNERLRIDQHGTTKFKGPLTEKCNYDAGAGLTGNYNHDLITYGNVHYAHGNSSGTWTYNLRGSGSVALNDMMSNGESLSFQLITAQNNTSYYMTAFKIDNNTQTAGSQIYWQGGSAPSAGGASGFDVYTFTIFKAANASWRVFASLSNHA